MPVIMQEPPAATVEALDKALARFVVRAGTAVTPAQIDAASAGADTTIRPSIFSRSATMAAGIRAWAARAKKDVRPPAAPVVVMGLDDLSAGKSPREVRPRLWAQFLDSSTEAPAVADVEVDTNRFLAVTEGPAISAMSRTIADARRQEGRQAEVRALSIIDVPALHLKAVWLKGEAGDADDIVIPSPGPIAPLEAGRRYSLDDFRRIVGEMARDRLRQVGPETGG